MSPGKWINTKTMKAEIEKKRSKKNQSTTKKQHVKILPNPTEFSESPIYPSPIPNRLAKSFTSKPISKSTLAPTVSFKPLTEAEQRKFDEQMDTFGKWFAQSPDNNESPKHQTSPVKNKRPKIEKTSPMDGSEKEKEEEETLIVPTQMGGRKNKNRIKRTVKNRKRRINR